jgi:hypothetical protein
VPNPAQPNQWPNGDRIPLGDAAPDQTPSPSTDTSDESVVSHENNYTHFGDHMAPEKPSKIFWGMSCQLGGLPVHSKDPKYKTLIKTILNRQIDVVAMQEIGLNFNCTGASDQWKHRIGWNTWLDGHRTKTVNAWNSLDRVKRLDQYGGVAILGLGRTSFYASGSGIDPSNLGRWCWTRYKGKDNLTLRVVSFYHPCGGNLGE